VPPQVHGDRTVSGFDEDLGYPVPEAGVRRQAVDEEERNPARIAVAHEHAEIDTGRPDTSGDGGASHDGATYPRARR
jgi:hypothetical protein